MAAGIPKSTWYLWMAIASGHTVRFPDGSPVAPSTVAFLARLGAAIGRAQANCELRQTKYITSAGAGDWRAAEAWLKRSEFSRERWREDRQLKVEQAGTISYEHRLIQQMPEAQVLELASPELAELVERCP